MKIKTFQFLLSNFAGNFVYNYDQSRYTPKKLPDTEKTIDKKINRWIEKNNAIVKDIKVTTYTLHRHNNAMSDTVCAIYTIMYDLLEGVENTEDSKEEA